MTAASSNCNLHKISLKAPLEDKFISFKKLDNLPEIIDFKKFIREKIRQKSLERQKMN